MPGRHRPARHNAILRRPDVAQRGILLVNLGSPAAPDVPAVRRYLDEFLMDPYVIDSPWPLRRTVVSAFILPFRPRRTAEAYASIWDSAGPGSPLLVHSRALEARVAELASLPVALAMRYGEPIIDTALANLLERGVDEMLLIALYPHHADSTRTTAVRAVRDALARRNASVGLRVLPPFYDDPDYVDVLAQHCGRHLPDDADLLLFSYHGLPERHITKADPTGSHCLKQPDCCSVPSPAHASCYRHQVHRTSELVAAQLGLDAARYRVSFQSRLGRLPWLTPYTDEVLRELPREGIERIAVACPAFVADNLETLEEIGIQGRRTFLEAGGAAFTLIPCLNAEAQWTSLVAKWCHDPLPESAVDD
jgi:protoporphyrin/coproporphyrin ferrochelatase